MCNIFLDLKIYFDMHKSKYIILKIKLKIHKNTIRKGKIENSIFMRCNIRNV